MGDCSFLTLVIFAVVVTCFTFPICHKGSCRSQTTHYEDSQDEGFKTLLNFSLCEAIDVLNVPNEPEGAHINDVMAFARLRVRAKADRLLTSLSGVMRNLSTIVEAGDLAISSNCDDLDTKQHVMKV